MKLQLEKLTLINFLFSAPLRGPCQFHRRKASRRVYHSPPHARAVVNSERTTNRGVPSARRYRLTAVLPRPRRSGGIQYRPRSGHFHPGRGSCRTRQNQGRQKWYYGENASLKLSRASPKCSQACSDHSYRCVNCSGIESRYCSSMASISSSRAIIFMTAILRLGLVSGLASTPFAGWRVLIHWRTTDVMLTPPTMHLALKAATMSESIVNLICVIILSVMAHPSSPARTLPPTKRSGYLSL